MSTLYVCNKKDVVVKTIESNSNAMLKLWALQNTKKNQKVYLFNEKSELTYVAVGQEGMPKIYSTVEEIESLGVEFGGTK